MGWKVWEWEVHLGQHHAQDMVLVNILLISVHTHTHIIKLHHAWGEIGSGLRNEISLAQACHDWQLLNSLVSYGPEVMPCRSCSQMADIQHHPLSTFFTPFPLLQLNVTFRKEVLYLRPHEPIRVTRPLLLYAISPLMSFHNSSLWKPLNANSPVYHGTNNTCESMWDLLGKSDLCNVCGIRKLFTSWTEQRHFLIVSLWWILTTK